MTAIASEAGLNVLM